MVARLRTCQSTLVVGLLITRQCYKLEKQSRSQTWDNVDGVHHGFDIGEVGEGCVKLETCGECEVYLVFGKLLDSGDIHTHTPTRTELESW